MFKKAYMISFPFILGLFGGMILCYEFNTYESATSRLRILMFFGLAYFISIIITSILSGRMLMNNNYKNRVMLGLLSLLSLTLVNEINFWNNDRFLMKNWASEPKQMMINSLIQLSFGIFLIMLVNIRPKNKYT
jgi:hypothetical protein